MTADQAVSGASNVLIAVLAARLLSPASFGLFGIVFLSYVVLQGVTRALVSDPLLVHPVEAEERPADVLAAGSLLALGLAAVTVVVGLGVHEVNSELGTALIVLGGFLPLLVLQDLGRYLGFATQRPGRALTLDLLWLVAVFVAAIALVSKSTHALAEFIAIWAGTGALSGLLTLWYYRQCRFLPNLRWLKETWWFSWRYLVSYAANQWTSLATYGVMGAIVGAKELGGAQGAVLLVRPFGTFQVAAIAAAIAEISRLRDDPHLVRRHARYTAALTAVIALLNTVVLLVLPGRIGRLFLGATWHVAKPFLLPVGIQIIFVGIATGARAGLLGSRLIRRSMVVDISSAGLSLVVTTVGVVVSGVSGALWAVAGATCVMSVTWWVVLIRLTGSPRPEVQGSTTALDPASVQP
jgi:O-antigen/teichoic acid export membrane protein